MVSRLQRISTSYSCAENCVADYAGSITPYAPVVAVGSVDTLTAWEQANYPNGSTMGPWQASATWSSNNTGVVTMQSSTCTAVAPGQTYVDAFIGTEDVYTWDGLDCLYNGTRDVIGNSPVTAIRITFQKADGTSLPSPLRVGITANNHDRKQQLRAVVEPTAEAANVTISVSNKLQLSDNSTSNGVITFKVVGTTKSDNAGDGTITARHSSGTTSAHSVSVVVPSKVGIPHDTTGGGQIIANRALNMGTRPAVVNVPTSQVLLVTMYARDLTITVLDQFGVSLGSLYQGADVSELVPTDNTYYSINSPLTASGTYLDFTGATQNKPTNPLVSAGSSAATSWLTQPTLSLPPGTNDSAIQNKSVKVDGFSLSPAIVNRTRTVSADANGNISVTITWPNN